jgi:hypothetical protein
LDQSRAVFGCIGSVLGSIGALWAPSWLSWLSWGALAPSCTSLGPSRSHLEAIFELSWRPLASAWATLEPPWGLLGAIWVLIGGIAGHLGPSLGHLEAILAPLGHLDAILGRLGQDPKNGPKNDPETPSHLFGSCSGYFFNDLFSQFLEHFWTTLE